MAVETLPSLLDYLFSVWPDCPEVPDDPGLASGEVPEALSRLRVFANKWLNENRMSTVKFDSGNCVVTLTNGHSFSLVPTDDTPDGSTQPTTTIPVLGV